MRDGRPEEAEEWMEYIACQLDALVELFQNPITVNVSTNGGPAVATTIILIPVTPQNN